MIRYCPIHMNRVGAGKFGGIWAIHGCPIRMNRTLLMTFLTAKSPSRCPQSPREPELPMPSPLPYPGKHWHVPVALRHSPRPEHSMYSYNGRWGDMG